MNKIEKYAKEFLANEIQTIEQSGRINELADLTVFEKAFILKYSNDGFESLNEQLRNSEGENIPQFGKLLESCLNKLNNFDGVVYRGANLTDLELNKYIDANTANEPLKEFAYISASKSRLIAMEFRGNVLFRIYSRSGKEIEKIAMHGIYGAPNEKEVLFKPNRRFNVLEVTQQAGYSLITLEEI
ncbi:MAG: hypothetical protein JSU01_20950 [Bacteroidetes bacterium]|nr:hypothetical protein [Bacteroidota bacterium]